MNFVYILLKMKNILITGGAGYIGSHCAVALIKNGYKPVIIDNFSNSYQKNIKQLELITKKKIIFYKFDLRNKKKLNKIIKKHNFYSVIHCAGFKAVGESCEKPISYFDNNINTTLSVLECMEKNKLFKIIFSSSATVYDNNQLLPFKETSRTGNTKNPYASSKYIIELILKDLAKHDNRWNIRIARYFNPISNHSSGLIEENPKGIPNNLIPYIVNVAKKKLPLLKIFGRNYQTKDGTGVRDYIHVMDLAYGHVAMLKNIGLKKGLKIYNLGTGKGLSVLEIINAFEKQTGKTLPKLFTKKRPGDIASSFCSSKKASRELKWKSKYDIEQAMLDLKKIINK